MLHGHSFENDAIRQLLKYRCNRVIVVLSPAFVQSPLNQFLANLALNLGILQQEERKLIPCIYKSCEIPDIFSHMHKMWYESSGSFNYWDKLSKSVERTPKRTESCAQVNIFVLGSAKSCNFVYSLSAFTVGLSQSFVVGVNITSSYCITVNDVY